MQIDFTKMHGLGNDFVVIDATVKPFAPSPELLARLTDRRFGVGCDQVLVIDPAPDRGADFGYRIYNADGSEVGQCGNGSRCLAQYVFDHGLSDKPDLVVRTRTTTLQLHRLDDGSVRVDMGVPRFLPQEIPLSVAARQAVYALPLADGSSVHFGAVGLGNPHAVIEVDDVDLAPVEELGRALQAHAAFSQGVNVGFVQFVDGAHARLRVYERGAGETLACGSGACAAMAVGRLWGRLDATAYLSLLGGILRLDWAGEGQPLLMTGPAASVYEGSLTWQS
jgi:diaminopimelate epimerase